MVTDEAKSAQPASSITRGINVRACFTINSFFQVLPYSALKREEAQPPKMVGKT